MKLAVTLISVLALSMVACSNDKASKIPVGSTLRGNDQLKVDSTNDPDLANLLQGSNCMPLKDLVDRLATYVNKPISVYISNFDVGTSTADAFTSVNDRLTVGRALLNSKPQLMEVVSGDSLASSAIVGDLLSVTAVKDDCTGATFTGRAFSISAPKSTTAKDADGKVVSTPVQGAGAKLILTDSTNGEIRVYSDDGNRLKIHVEKPITITACDGSTTTQSQSIDYVINHGNPGENFDLSPNLISILSSYLTAVPQEINNQMGSPTLSPDATVPVRTAAHSKVSVSYPSFELIQNMIDKGEVSTSLACPTSKKENI